MANPNDTVVGKVTNHRLADINVAANLESQDFKRVARARFAIWKNAALGILAGGSAGYLSYFLYAKYSQPDWLLRRHLTLFVLSGAAVGRRVLAWTPY